MLVDRGVIKVGFEIEVPRWKNGRKYINVVRDLLSQDFMLGAERDWAEIHRYRCNCENGCGAVRRGDVIIPPLVSATYDASLPEGGGEFVTSPILLLENGIAPIRPIWDTVVQDAEWNDKIQNLRGDGLASPSVHIHLSVNTDEEYDPGIRTDNLRHDIMHALWLVSPELLALADTAGVRRGMQYRQLMRMAENGGHHGFIHIRDVALPTRLHIEWRLFEAAYDSFEYLESATYVAAGLTRMVSDPISLNDLMRMGLDYYLDERGLEAAVLNNDTQATLGFVDRGRMAQLRAMLVDHLVDDEYGQEKVRALFETAEGRL